MKTQLSAESASEGLIVVHLLCWRIVLITPGKVGGRSLMYSHTTCRVECIGEAHLLYLWKFLPRRRLRNEIIK